MIVPGRRALPVEGRLSIVEINVRLVNGLCPGAQLGNSPQSRTVTFADCEGRCDDSNTTITAFKEFQRCCASSNASRATRVTLVAGGAYSIIPRFCLAHVALWWCKPLKHADWRITVL